MAESRSIGNEVVYYVRTTPTGVAVEKRDGTGLSGGYFSKNFTRYFYGETATDDAIDYAESKTTDAENKRVELAPTVEA